MYERLKTEFKSSIALSTAEFGSSQRCDTFDAFYISFEPFCMCIAVFFGAIVGEGLTPIRKCCFDAVKILKLPLIKHLTIN